MILVLSATKCLGHPFCDKRVEKPSIACRYCWFKIPISNRNLLKALIYKGAKEETGKRIVAEARGILYKKLEAILDAKVKKAQYTVTPYTGVFRKRKIDRKRNSRRYMKYLKEKHYGGPPWGYEYEHS